MNRVEERELTIRLVKAAERIAEAMNALCAIMAGNPQIKAEWYAEGRNEAPQPGGIRAGAITKGPQKDNKL